MQAIRERLSVTTAYGEPVTANSVTVIPVSTVKFALGGGGGSGSGGEGADQGSGSGGGMGGGGSVEPVGYIEIGDAGTRWVALEPSRSEMLLRAFAMAPLFLGGKRGGLFPRIALFVAGQALISGLARRRSLGDGFQRLSFPRRGPVTG
jgi:uncharacterized spore protein YtfJ